MGDASGQRRGGDGDRTAGAQALLVLDRFHLVARLHKAIDEVRAKEAKQLKKPAELAKSNRQFHHAIYASAHNRYLMQTLNTLRNSLALLRGTTFSVPGRAKVAHREHKEIVAAILARDGVAAEQAARAHIRGAERARIKMLFELAR